MGQHRAWDALARDLKLDGLTDGKVHDGAILRRQGAIAGSSAAARRSQRRLLTTRLLLRMRIHLNHQSSRFFKPGPIGAKGSPATLVNPGPTPYIDSCL